MSIDVFTTELTTTLPSYQEYNSKRHSRDCSLGRDRVLCDPNTSSAALSIASGSRISVEQLRGRPVATNEAHMQTPPERHVLDFETLHNVLAVDRAVEHSIVDVSQATAAPSNQALAIRLSSQDPFRRPALSDHTAVRASISGHSHSQQRDFDFTPFSSSTRDTGHQCRHREIPSLTSPVDCYAASPDKWSPAGDWHLQKTIRTERKHIPYCNSLALSHDGRFVASGHEDGVIILWSTQTDDIVSGPLKGHTRRVNDIAFSLKDERIVTGSTLSEK